MLTDTQTPFLETAQSAGGPSYFLGTGWTGTSPNGVRRSNTLFVSGCPRTVRERTCVTFRLFVRERFVNGSWAFTPRSLSLYISLYISLSIYIYIYTHIHVYMCTYIYIYIYNILIYQYLSLSMYTYLSLYTYIYIYVYMHIYIYI